MLKQEQMDDLKSELRNTKAVSTLLALFASPAKLIIASVLYLRAGEGLYTKEFTDIVEHILGHNISTRTVPHFLNDLEKLGIVKIFTEPYFFPDIHKSGIRSRTYANPNALELLHYAYTLVKMTDKFMEEDIEKLQRYAEGVRGKQDTTMPGKESEYENSIQKAEARERIVQVYSRNEETIREDPKLARAVREGNNEDWL